MAQVQRWNYEKKQKPLKRSWNFVETYILCYTAYTDWNERRVETIIFLSAWTVYVQLYQVSRQKFTNFDRVSTIFHVFSTIFFENHDFPLFLIDLELSVSGKASRWKEPWCMVWKRLTTLCLTTLCVVTTKKDKSITKFWIDIVFNLLFVSVVRAIKFQSCSPVNRFLFVCSQSILMAFYVEADGSCREKTTDVYAFVWSSLCPLA